MKNQKHFSEKKWMTTSELAKYLTLAKGTIRNWVCQNKIPYYKQYGKLYFNIQEIDNWMMASKVEAIHFLSQLNINNILLTNKNY